MPETPSGRPGSIRLSDGRTLAYAEYGLADGVPVVYFHGTPSAQSEWLLFGDDEILARRGIRLIAPDRPGMGGSTFLPGRRVADWPNDLRQLLDGLGVERCALLAYSGGGPYAVAWLLAAPERTSSVVLIAPVCHDRPELTEGLDPNGLRQKELAATRPFMARQVMRVTMELPARLGPGALTGMMRRVVPEVDQALIADRAGAAAFTRAIRDAFRRGPRGPQHEMGLMASPWGLDLRPIEIPLQIWQGELDIFGARPAMAEYIRSALGAPVAAVHLLPEGHLSIFANHVEEALEALSV